MAELQVCLVIEDEWVMIVWVGRGENGDGGIDG
jgi:hypothetical protein